MTFGTALGERQRDFAKYTWSEANLQVADHSLYHNTYICPKVSYVCMLDVRLVCAGL